MTKEATNKPRFKERYDSEIKKSLKEKYGFKNDLEIPTRAPHFRHIAVLNMVLRGHGEEMNMLKKLASAKESLLKKSADRKKQKVIAVLQGQTKTTGLRKTSRTTSSLRTH